MEQQLQIHKNYMEMAALAVSKAQAHADDASAAALTPGQFTPGAAERHAAAANACANIAIASLIFGLADAINGKV